MRLYAVTLKVPQNPHHDPNDKKVGDCPIHSGKVCTDSTGGHHTALIQASNRMQAEEITLDLFAHLLGRVHITRIEEM